MSEPIVITAGELVCSLGLSRAQAWESLIAGEAGIGPLTELEQLPKEPHGGGQAPPLPQDEAPSLPREIRYLRWLFEHLLAGGGASSLRQLAPNRIGVIMGTTLHGIRAAGRFFRDGDLNHWRLFQAPAVLRKALAGMPVEGPMLTTCAACASGLSAIGMGMTLLRNGELDAVICGGYDPVSEYAYGGFHALRLIAPDAVRPFCRDRQGMKLGEGYAAFVLERGVDVAQRGAQVLATIAGYAESSDAHHLTQPHPDGVGAASAMRAAMKQAGVAESGVDAIFAHATGTPDNDRGEHAAMRLVHGDRLRSLPVVALKSRLGHTLGGAGAVELLLALTAIERGAVPATAGVTDESLEYDDLRIMTKPTPKPMQTVQSQSIGFGGANSSIILTTKSLGHEVPTARSRTAVITGVGVLLPGCIGIESMNALMNTERSTCPSQVDDADFEPLIAARRVRRLSRLVKLCLAATALACRDAALEGEGLKQSSVILGTNHGSAQYSEDYYREIVEKGVDAANPMLFAEGVPNAPAAHLSMAFGCTGGSQAVIGSRSAGLEALHLAHQRIRSGECDRIIVCAGEEASPLMQQVYAGLHAFESTAHGDVRLGEGAVALLVESEESARSRGVPVRAVIEATACGAARSAGLKSMLRCGRRLWRDLGSPTAGRQACGGTWLDALERRMMNRTASRSDIKEKTIIHETFCVMSLASMAVTLMAAKQGIVNHEDRSDSYGFISAGLDGTLAAARLRPVRR